MTSNAIRNVSGTAFFIAQFRAMEAAHEPPLFRDPWAAQLAGTRGLEIMQQLTGSERIAWVVSIRTAELDRMILEALARDGYDTVVSLGAGLDTRPFRLDLPEGLRWIDVDKREIIDYKRRILDDSRPRCRWETVIADLSDQDVRVRTFADLAANSRRSLVLSEGLLEYLSEEAVRQLARELRAWPVFQSWLLNLYGKAVLRPSAQWREVMARENAEIRFTPAAGAHFFDTCGWSMAESSALIDKGVQLRRLSNFERRVIGAVLRFGPAGLRARVRGAATVVRLERRLA